LGLTPAETRELLRRRPDLAPVAGAARSRGGRPIPKPRQMGKSVHVGSGRVIELTLPMDPPTVTHHDKQIHRFAGGRRGLEDSDELKAAKERYAKLLAASGRRPRAPLDGPIRLDARFVFPHPTRTDWHTEKPDRHNPRRWWPTRCSTRGSSRADQRICSGDVQKWWGPVGSVWIRMTELSGGERTAMVAAATEVDGVKTLEEVEREHILATLRRFKGHRHRRTAAALKIGRGRWA
jgi:Holliday junction resolvase RusA-like endonuclease